MKNLLNTKDFKEITAIYLQLGPECNMQCRHCHQTPDKEITVVASKISDATMQFLDNFIAFTQQEKFVKKAENRKEIKPLFRISLWGGEPLLHWKLIKEIVTHFYEKYHYTNNKAFRFSTTTNGLGITDEAISFFNKYRVIVSFSYDAPYPWAVRGYVSDKICEQVNKIDLVRIVSAGCAYNCDPMLAYKCLQAKFPKAQFKIGIEILRTFPTMPEDVDTYNFDKVRNFIRKLCIATKMGDKRAFEYLCRVCNTGMHPKNNYPRQHHGASFCISGYHELSVGLDGTIPFCYNSYHKIGSLEEDTLDTIYQKAKEQWDKIYDKKCETCDCQDLCSWNCALILRDRENHAYTCEKFRKPFIRIVKEEVLELFSPLTEEEKEWYIEQEKIMEQQVQAFLLEGKRYEKEHTRFPKNMIEQIREKKQIR